MVDIVIRMKEKSPQNTIDIWRRLLSLLENSDIADRLIGFRLEYPDPAMERIRREDYDQWTEEKRDLVLKECSLWREQGCPDIEELPGKCPDIEEIRRQIALKEDNK